MFRKGSSIYEYGRSHAILKYKTMKDGEAQVQEIFGIYVKCKLPNRLFFIARNGVEDPVKIGDIVTYKCLSFSQRGIPKQPVVFRKREDITWEDVLQLYG